MRIFVQKLEFDKKRKEKKKKERNEGMKEESKHIFDKRFLMFSFINWGRWGGRY